MGENVNDDGPVAWTIVIPVTRRTKELFLNSEIGETELVTLTLEEMTRDRHVIFSSIYLCSVLVLPEFRGKGIAKELLGKSITAIRKDHPIEELFVWAFSGEGNGLAKNIAAAMKLPLFERRSR
jgi:GNAT superfamily N-acetyltransferase